MKQTDNGMVFHPLYPSYLIVDYILEYQRTNDASFLEHAKTMAAHALKRSEMLGDARIFKYTPESDLSYVPGTFYSALTQARLLQALCRLSAYSGNRYDKAIREIFRSLLIPLESGGVLLKKPFGWITEEFPREPPLYTLNGWMTLLCVIVECQATLDRLGIDCADFLEQNLNALEKLLPLYDAPFCMNSRYQLAGFSRLRMNFSTPTKIELMDFSVEIPGENAPYKGSLTPFEKNRWGNYLERQEGRLVQFNVILSLASHPTPNRVRVKLSVDKNCEVTFRLASGEYDPSLSAMPTQDWITLSTRTLMANALSELVVDIPFTGKDLYAYPTNFRKKIDGKFCNAYHFVHILDLARLYKYSRRSIFREYASKWMDYADTWPKNPLLPEDRFSVLQIKHGTNLRQEVENIMRD